MLSAHEFATLILGKESADHIADREELGTLLGRRLVALERLAGGAVRPPITEDGESPSPCLNPLMRAIRRVPLRRFHLPDSQAVVPQRSASRRRWQRLSSPPRR